MDFLLAFSDSMSEALSNRRRGRPKATKFVPATHATEVTSQNFHNLSTKVAKLTVGTQTPISTNRFSASSPSSQQSHCIKKDEMKTVHKMKMT